MDYRTRTKNMEHYLFIEAAKGKYRYPYKGNISTEELWDLSTEELDEVFRQLRKELMTKTEVSVLDEIDYTREDKSKTPELQIVENKMEIIKLIVRSKLNNQEEMKERMEKERKKSEIQSILADRQKEEFRDTSTDELQKMLDELK